MSGPCPSVPWAERRKRSAGAFDILGRACYWHQAADLSFDIAGVADIGDLPVAGAWAFTRSGSVDWIDPLL